MFEETGKKDNEFKDFIFNKNGIQKNEKSLTLDESLYALYEYGCHLLNDNLLIKPIGVISFKRFNNELLNRIDKIINNKNNIVKIKMDESISLQGMSENINPIQHELRRDYKVNSLVSIKKPLVIFLPHDYGMINGFFMQGEIDMFEKYISKYNIPVIYITDDMDFSSKLYNSVVKNECSY